MRSPIEMTVRGRKVSLDIDGDASIRDLDDDMGEISRIIARYGEILAAARSTIDIRDAGYRQWRALTMKELFTKHVKLPEYKLKAMVESKKEFFTHKQEIAEARELAWDLEVALDALKIKAEMMRSKGANKRSELENLGMRTMSRSREPDDDIDDKPPAPRRRPKRTPEERRDGVRAAFKKDN